MVFLGPYEELELTDPYRGIGDLREESDWRRLCLKEKNVINQ